jgi:hypothetical protein
MGWKRKIGSIPRKRYVLNLWSFKAKGSRFRWENGDHRPRRLFPESALAKRTLTLRTLLGSSGLIE